MKTNGRFKQLLKEFMLDTPLSEITVAMLCEECGLKRQTFYYYYRDVLDLYAEVILSERIEGFKDSKRLSTACLSLLDYTVDNFEFLRNAFNNGGGDLTSDFFSGLLMQKMLSLYKNGNNGEFDVSLKTYRVVARRYSKYIVDEIAYYLGNTLLTEKTYEKNMRKFISLSQKHILPALVQAVELENKQ